MLVAMCGLPGSGKSTLAKLLSKKIGATVISTDVIRKKLIEKPSYTEEEKKLIYKIVFLLAEYFLSKKIPCIIDATFTKEWMRKEASNIAKKQKTKFYLVECICDEKVIKKRIKKKRKFSDADIKIYFLLKKEFEKIRERHISVDTTLGTKHALKKLLMELNVKHN